MIKNSICPYCNRAMNNNPGDNLQKTKEHLIPKALYRNDKDIPSDFYACRKCNGILKAKLDNIVSLITKLNSLEDELVIASFNKKTDEIKRAAFLKHKKIDDNLVSIKFDIEKSELHEYGRFLVKGEYFMRNHKVLDIDIYDIDIFGSSTRRVEFDFIDYNSDCAIAQDLQWEVTAYECE